MEDHHIFYIIGKSATGKDHFYKALLEEFAEKLFPVILYTTRPMRAGETEGREYHFITGEKLREMRSAGLVIEERCYQTVAGPWCYATAAAGIDLDAHDYLGIGTLESFEALKRYYGSGRVIPLYIETEDRIRLERSMKREAKQSAPRYDEMCRRFLADQEDFSEEKIFAAGVAERFANNGEFADTLDLLKAKIRTVSGKGTK